VSPLRDPLGFDGSAKPVGGSEQLLLRRLLPGFGLWWSWRQSKRAASRSASADPAREDRVQKREPDQQ
jgi:hypothetical protein